MIELIREPLPVDSAAKLRRWLKSSEGDILRRVVEAECQFSQAKALRKALTAAKGSPADLLAQDDMVEARRYSEFIVILDTLSDPDYKLHIAKLKPHQKYASTNDPGENTTEAE